MFEFGFKRQNRSAQPTKKEQWVWIGTQPCLLRRGIVKSAQLPTAPVFTDWHSQPRQVPSHHRWDGWWTFLLITSAHYKMFTTSNRHSPPLQGFPKAPLSLGTLALGSKLWGLLSPPVEKSFLFLKYIGLKYSYVKTFFLTYHAI